LVLKTEIIDKAFHVFVSEYQNSDKEPKLGVEQIITLCKIRNGIFQQLKPAIVKQLEEQGLIEKTASSSNKYVLPIEYHQLVDESLKISKRYLVKEIEVLVLALQKSTLKIGELENQISESLNRNQIKYLITKLVDDKVIETKGAASGTKYLLTATYSDLRGNLLVQKIIADLRSKYE
jgi:ATP-dependent DNA helicase RecG